MEVVFHGGRGKLEDHYSNGKKYGQFADNTEQARQSLPKPKADGTAPPNDYERTECQPDHQQVHKQS